MNTSRVTISMPEYIVDKLRKMIPERQMSRYITRLVEADQLNPAATRDPIKAFLALRKRAPKLSMKAIKRAIEKGRT